MANPADLKTSAADEVEAIGKSDFDLSQGRCRKIRADDQKVICGEPVINRKRCLDDAGEKRWL